MYLEVWRKIIIRIVTRFLCPPDTLEDTSDPFEADHGEPSHVTGSTVGALGHSVPMVAGERTKYSTRWTGFFLHLA